MQAVTEAYALVKAAFNKTVRLICVHVLIFYITIIQKDFVLLADEATVLATSYTVNYSDSSSGETCGLSTIPASSCGETVCGNAFEVSSTSCFNFTNISVSVSALSRLGNGPASEQTLITLQQYNNR